MGLKKQRFHLLPSFFQCLFFGPTRSNMRAILHIYVQLGFVNQTLDLCCNKHYSRIISKVWPRLTGKVSSAAPVLMLYTFRNTLRALSFSPQVIKNFGLSGKNTKRMPQMNAGSPDTNRNMFHEWKSEINWSSNNSFCNLNKSCWLSAFLHDLSWKMFKVF